MSLSLTYDDAIDLESLTFNLNLIQSSPWLRMSTDVIDAYESSKLNEKWVLLSSVKLIF
jgi:hypothetical protein